VTAAAPTDARSVLSRSERDTARIARALARTLLPASTVLLFGDLGAGKTAFVRGLAEGLGIDPAEVSSPTFAIMQEYGDERRLLHVDLYRLGPHEVDDLGLEELSEGKALTAVEWAERMPRPVTDAVEVRLEDAGDTRRRITIRRPPRRDAGRPTPRYSRR
jgi:tRNA threonylcarbamoyladenosine biosynthesis protein TsaE